MRGKTVRRLGVAVVGAGRVGTFRAQIAARHPAVDWIGLAERVPERGEALAQRIGADYVTPAFRKLLARPEVTCVVVA
ncbi:MAG: Gfo/Idh/MocA family oxidoreductase, partial [Armatimonadota bacterium]|nr:Gfo/Idh/MocA family oxidoreductase [Armatimonadota bacterium]